MRYVYCASCGNVSTKARLEPDVCATCGATAERIGLRRPWQSYLSSVILVVATGVLIFGPIVDGLQRALIVVGVLVAAFALSAWSLRVSRERVLRIAESRKPSKGGKA